MKVLHLYSDWKWTGPAEPVLQACWSLQQQGHNVLLAFREPQLQTDEDVKLKAEQMGVRATTRFALDRYIHPRGTLYDLFNLPRFIRDEGFQIVHVHLSHDHAMGGLCCRRLGKHRPMIVRTLHRRSVLKDTIANQVQMRWFTDGCLTFTEDFRQEYIHRFGLNPDHIGVLPMTVDLDRFHPGRQFRDMRAEFGIAPDAPTIGIVGRFQRYRRMEVFLEAARRVVGQEPSVRFVIIGRSSKLQETVVQPVERLGIKDQVILAGYRTADYVDVLACLDIFSLLMPGFDGTARAVREALALGKPCVVADYGMLPDIVSNNETGLVAADGDPADLARAWLELIRNPQRRIRMGQAARLDAEKRFRVDNVGPCLEQFYEQLLANRAALRSPTKAGHEK